MGFRRKPRSIAPQRSADLKDVRSAAISLLARRDFASGALAQRLIERGWDAAVTATVVTQLIAERALDDARFAGNYVAYHANRGQGPVRISMDLRTLGLPAELIDGAVAEGSDWRVRARLARVRRFGPDAPEAWSEKSRQARFLQYRGFSSDHIRAALGTDFNLDDDT